MKRRIQKLVSEVLGNMFEQGQLAALPSFDITIPKENFGDFSLNVAHAIAREGKFQVNDVADIIARELKNLDKDESFSDIKVLNGFINIFISPEKTAENVLRLGKTIKPSQVGKWEEGKAKKIVFEYSSPNTNKPLHIGHTRNDVYGVACINLLREVGYDVTATEIINDRGIHIMKSMLMYQKFGNNTTPESEGMKPDHFVGKFYSMFSVQCSKSEANKVDLENEARQLLLKWEAGDAPTLELWKKMNSWFYEGVKQTYEKEGSHFDAVDHESDIYDKGRDLVLAGVEKGIFSKEADGSVSIDLTDKGLDKKYLLRADGSTIYITQDMYLWHLRNEKYHPDMAIVTTSSEQAYHFKVLSYIFEAMQLPWASTFRHLPYEHVYLGKAKMSSREGNTISADDLLQTVKEKVKDIITNSQKVKAEASDDKLVEEIAFAAIKYGYLKYDRNTKIYFDLEETVAIEGNTGPYLQYTNARIKSIKRQAGDSIEQNDLLALTTPAEQSLIRYLLHYEDVIVSGAEEFRPNIICNYLFELSGKFNYFYDQVSVLKAETEELKQQRLSLLNSVSKVLEHGLGLLGIKAPEQM